MEVLTKWISSIIRKLFSVLIVSDSNKLISFCKTNIKFSFILLLIFLSQTSFATGELYHLNIDFMPNIKQKRITLSDEQNTHSVISSKLSYGFDINFGYQFIRDHSYLQIGIKQNTVRLTETSNATLDNEELNYLETNLYYEFHARFSMFRIGAEYLKEYYMLIENNIVEPTSLQNIYGVAGYHIITKVGYKSKAFIGLDYGSLASSSQIQQKDLKSAHFYRFETRFVFNYQTLSYLLKVFYKSSVIEYENIQQTIPEVGLGIGIRF